MSKGSLFVVGGAGFIGRWVVAHALREDRSVAVYDNLCAGRRENLALFLNRIEFTEGDILDEDALKVALRKTSPDTVFHLAAHHYIPFCNAHPVDTLEVNVLGTYSVLNAALNAGVETVVVASSGALYRNTVEPLSEDGEVPVPYDVYGLSKLLCEKVAEFFANTCSLRCIVARLFNTYGPFETNPHLISHIIESLREGLSIELGNLEPKRDYVYVEDVAEALFRCSLINDHKFVVVNVGSGQEYSAREVVGEISKILGRQIEIVPCTGRMRAQDKMHQIADTRKLSDLTGFRCGHTLRDGLGKLLAHEGLR